MGLKSAFLGTVCAIAIATSAFAQAKSIDVPAGDLKSGLDAYIQQSGAQLIYKVDQVRGLTTHGAHGNLTPDAALHDLLRGTGLVVHQDESGALVVSAVVRSKNVQAASNEAAPQDVETVVVTGTLIPGITPASAVITVGQTDIQRSGYQTTRQILTNLPQSSGGGDNPTTSAVSGGFHNVSSVSAAASADLRGLGSESTLMLVDGHRLSYDGLAGSSDISLVPLGAIERVEILTDGASALYGSDAVAGVVNFILRKDFDGLNTNVNVGGATQGGAFEQQYSVLGGKTWDGGNVVASYEHFQQDALDASERSFTHDAAAPTTLMPDTRRDSLFLSANQDLTSSLSAFFEGLYTDRYANTIVSYNVAGGITAAQPNSVHEYNLVGGLRASVGTWQATLTGQLSRDADNQPNPESVAGTPVLPTEIDRYANGLASVDAIFEGPLFSLPSGNVDVALGGGYRHESFSYAQTGTATINARRGVSYGFAETHVPLVSQSQDRIGLEGLDLSASVRYEDYSDFGSTTNPKIGLRWTVTSDIALRGTWGTSFHAPTLLQEHQPIFAVLFGIPDPLSSSGTSPALITGGGNAALQPETAKSWAAGTDYSPGWASGLTLQATYFSIQYSDRIVTPVPNTFSALTNPLYAPFVTRNPSAMLQAQTIASAASFNNYTGAPYDPSTVAALIGDAYNNAARETARGFDLLGTYVLPAFGGDFDLSANVSYLDSQMQLSPAGGFETESGTLFSPSRWRGRLGASWNNHEWSLSTFFNFQSGETDPNQTPATRVASYQTLDAQIAYAPEWANGLRVSASVLNLLDANPPDVSDASTHVSGIHYDGANASPLGRFISLQVSKDW